MGGSAMIPVRGLGKYRLIADVSGSWELRCEVCNYPITLNGKERDPQITRVKGISTFLTNERPV